MAEKSSLSTSQQVGLKSPEAKSPDKIASLTFEELSPLLSLLDFLIDHTTPIAPPSTPSSPQAPAVWDLSTATPLHQRFIMAAFPLLSRALAAFGCVPQRSSDSKTLLVITRSDSAPLSRGEVFGLIQRVERRLAEPQVVLQRLQATAQRTMAACIDVIEKRCGSYVDVKRLRECKVQPGAFFNMEWSVGLETAWQASGAEGILTMPNYVRWTPAHVEHRLKSWRGVDTKGVDPARVRGRLWRFEFWEASRTPCHEVIHLVQHITRQRASHQIAEHDGAFSTYLLMLMCAESDSKLCSPGIMEQALLESQDYVQKALRHALTEEGKDPYNEQFQADYTRWRDSFGVATVENWGTSLPFGGKISVENLCKNLVAFEAICPGGAILEGKQISAASDAMLDTMFHNRTGQLSEVPVQIREQVRLAGMSTEERVASATARIGDEAAVSLLGSFNI